jgi:hypothetical protein
MKWELHLHRPVFLTFSPDGTLTSAGSSSGRTLRNLRECRNDWPDQAASASTSTTTGSTSVSSVGDAWRLKRSRVVPFTTDGQGWTLAGGRNQGASALLSAAFNVELRPTIRSSPSIGSPATISVGRSTGPMTAAQMTSTTETCLALSRFISRPHRPDCCSSPAVLPYQPRILSRCHPMSVSKSFE